MKFQTTHKEEQKRWFNEKLNLGKEERDNRKREKLK
jgi:hypothetical protein